MDTGVQLLQLLLNFACGPSSVFCFVFICLFICFTHLQARVHMYLLFIIAVMSLLFIGHAYMHFIVLTHACVLALIVFRAYMLIIVLCSRLPACSVCSCSCLPACSVCSCSCVPACSVCSCSCLPVCSVCSCSCFIIKMN